MVFVAMFMAFMLSCLLSCFCYSKNRKPVQVPLEGEKSGYIPASDNALQSPMDDRQLQQNCIFGFIRHEPEMLRHFVLEKSWRSVQNAKTRHKRKQSTWRY